MVRDNMMTGVKTWIIFDRPCVPYPGYFSSYSVYLGEPECQFAIPK